MARSVNKVILIGNVGNPPDVRTTPSGTQVAKVSLATSRTFNDRSGNQQERTQWHRLTFFGKLADVVEQWVGKGDRLFVEGRLEYSTTEADGVTRYWTDIIVNELVMLGNRDQNNGGGRSQQRQSRPASKPAKSSKPLTEPDDDLPF